MFKRSRIKLLTFALAMVAGLSACDTGTERLTAPQMDLTEEEARMGYTWNGVAVGTVTPVSETVVTAVIGKQGGVIRNGDHTLMIPNKAVDSETEFTFKVLGGNRIAVDFSARRVSDGLPVVTFPVALTMRLSYKNANATDPYRLFNAYVLEGSLAGAKQRLSSTVSTFTQTVSSPITHFSEYEMGID